MMSSESTDVKLTKQQKRDMRRNANAQKVAEVVKQESTTNMVDAGAKMSKQDKRDLKRKHESTVDDRQPIEKSAPKPIQQGSNEIPAGEKLTKQQKRDLKRKAQREAGNIPKSFVKTVPKELIENSSVYRRQVVFPPEFTEYKGKKDRFVRPSDPQFNDIVATSYSGLVVEAPEKFAASFHDSFRTALEQLEKDNIYQFDLTQPTGLGTKVAKTFVSRCLVGDAGITYKYLGLRMFAHPWNEGATGASAATIAIGKRNQDLIRHTTKLLKQSGRENYGSCQFNLTLINRCYPEGEVVKLKEEPYFKKDKCTVSWHADSCLDHYSTIAVYHTVNEKNGDSSNNTENSATVSEADGESEQKHKKAKHDKKEKVKSTSSGGAGASAAKNAPWELALRIQHNAEGPQAGKPSTAAMGLTGTDGSSEGAAVAVGESVTPSLAVPLPDRTSYFLLDDFNHHHQHSVLAGSTDRYASTHRVSRVEGHTYEYIKNKCQSGLQLKCGMNVKTLRLEQLSLSEVEFEWIRQYYVQGSLHHELHSWWHAPMSVLMDLWMRLEQRTQIVIQALRDAALGVESQETHDKNGGDCEGAAGSSRKQLMKRSKYAECVTSPEVYDEMISFLSERQTKREGWHSRYQDPLYKKQPANCQPMTVPFPALSKLQYAEENPLLGKTAHGVQCLTEVVKKLEEWKEVYLSKQ